MQPYITKLGGYYIVYVLCPLITRVVLYQFYNSVVVVTSAFIFSSSNSVHSFGSSKSSITKTAPASVNNCSGFLVPNPTTGIPAPVPAFIPETESWQSKIHNKKGTLDQMFFQLVSQHAGSPQLEVKRQTSNTKAW